MPAVSPLARQQGRGGVSRPARNLGFRAIDPLARFIYRLLRDHLPVGEVERAVKMAKAEGYAAAVPELEELAGRLAATLEEISEDTVREARATPPPPSSREEVKKPTASPDDVPTVEVPDGARRTGRVMALLVFEQNPGRWLKLPAVHEAIEDHVASYNVVRQGVQALVREGKVEARGNTAAREYRLGERSIGNGKTSEPDPDDEGEGLSPDDPSGEAGGEDHDDGRADAGASRADAGREHRGSGDGDRQSGSVAAGTTDGASGDQAETPDAAAPAGSPSDSSAGGRGQAREDDESSVKGGPADATPGGAPAEQPLVERVAEFIDAAGEDVFPVEIERHFDIQASARLRVISELFEAGRVAILAPRSQYTRYRSAKKRRPAAAGSRQPSESEAAEPLGDSGVNNFRDSSKEREAEAKAEQDAAVAAAAKVLPSVREWIRSAGTFTPRKLRDVFDLDKAAARRVIAVLSADSTIERVGEDRAETYEAAGGNSNGSGERRGRRPLSEGAQGSTLEGRALGVCGGEGATLHGVRSQLGVSEEVARRLLSDLYRQGEVRPKSRNGEIRYIAVA